MRLPSAVWVRIPLLGFALLLCFSLCLLRFPGSGTWDARDEGGKAVKDVNQVSR